MSSDTAHVSDGLFTVPAYVFGPSTPVSHTLPSQGFGPDMDGVRGSEMKKKRKKKKAVARPWHGFRLVAWIRGTAPPKKVTQYRPFLGAI